MYPTPSGPGSEPGAQFPPPGEGSIEDRVAPGATPPRRGRHLGRTFALVGIVVRDYVNRVLDKDPDYDGSISDVDISLVRGAYVIHGVEIFDTKGDAPVPFFESQ